MGRDILGGNIEGNSHSVGPWGMKPINFGSHKAEGSETNTVFGYRGGGHIMLFKVEGSETHILLAHNM